MMPDPYGAQNNCHIYPVTFSCCHGLIMSLFPVCPNAHCMQVIGVDRRSAGSKEMGAAVQDKKIGGIGIDRMIVIKRGADRYSPKDQATGLPGVLMLFFCLLLFPVSGCCAGTLLFQLRLCRKKRFFLFPAHRGAGEFEAVQRGVDTRDHGKQCLFEDCRSVRGHAPLSVCQRSPHPDSGFTAASYVFIK